MPTTTPPISSTARSRRWPIVAPTQITAAIDANTGRCVPSTRTARYQAATAAAAVWMIGHSRGCSRRRAVRSASRPSLGRTVARARFFGVGIDASDVRSPSW